MNGFPKIKTVNGKQVDSDNCVTCGTKVESGRWLCTTCTKTIGANNIFSTINNMPDYLADDQYNKWLKLKLSQFIYANKE